MKKIEKFLINEGLYGKGMDISIDDSVELKEFLEGYYKINAYCTECKNERIFTAERSNTPTGMRADKTKSYEILIRRYPSVIRIFSCAMNEDHELTFCCMLTENNIIKYGQFPSLADLNETDTKKYRKILNDKYADFNRGVGLYSHGIGAGSLIYLRRVFEYLIEQAHNKASKETPSFNENKFPMRMDKKIHILKDFLPSYLVENRKIYGILSKGVHELPEEDCKEIFPVIKLGIELILDDEIERREHEEKKETTAQNIANLSEKYNR